MYIICIIYAAVLKKTLTRTAEIIFTSSCTCHRHPKHRNTCLPLRMPVRVCPHTDIPLLVRRNHSRMNNGLPPCPEGRALSTAPLESLCVVVGRHHQKEIRPKTPTAEIPNTEDSPPQPIRQRLFGEHWYSKLEPPSPVDSCRSMKCTMPTSKKFVRMHHNQSRM